MAGYYGYSMSNNARDAYACGEKPKSKWTKAAIINEAVALHTDPEKVEALKKLSAATLRYEFLYNSSWHHTSKYFNRTEFYALDDCKIDNMTVDEILALKD